MPKLAEIKEIDGEVWVRIGKPGEFPSGIALWAPAEQKAVIEAEREACAEIALAIDSNRGNEKEIAKAIRARSTAYLDPEYSYREPAYCQCGSCTATVRHKSDCAVHNEPAYPAGPCDCGAAPKIPGSRKAGINEH